MKKPEEAAIKTRPETEKAPTPAKASALADLKRHDWPTNS
jgi:hypothetical protein